MTDLTKYEEIVRKYTKQIYKYCYYNLNYNEYLTDEAVNDVMRILFERWDTLDVDYNIRAWLYRVADNCIKHSLSRYARYYSHIDSLDESIKEGKLNGAKYYDEYFKDDSAEDEYMDKIISSLPDEYKEIFKMRYIEKRTIQETSEILGIPYASLYLRLKKIEVAVKKEIEKIFK